MSILVDGIVTASDCAACRECCFFECYTLSDTPTVSDDTAVAASILDPGVRFTEPYGRRLFMMLPTDQPEKYVCPMLDGSTGCRLGELKPFECRLFPFALMCYKDKRVLTVSPSCPCLANISSERIRQQAQELFIEVLEEADRSPELVRPFEAGYTIMCVEQG